jgi:hypothetical protein
MKAQENIARRGPVIWSNYETKLNQMDILFRFISHAFHNLSETKRREFVKGLKQEAEADTVRKVESLREVSKPGGIAEGIFDETSLLEFQDRHQKQIKSKYRPRTHTQYAEWVTDGMLSAEILFRVTVFEDFMKHVHANMLKGNPGILGLTDRSRTVTVADVFSPGFEQFKEKQICREVKKVDRESMSYRLDYFAMHLGIDLEEKRRWLIEISELRNKIAHGSPLEAVTKDDTTIPLAELQKQVANTLRDVMSAIFDKAQAKDTALFLKK